MPALSVCFLHVGPDLAIPTLMVASARRAMPGAEIVQMTDQSTAAVPGVDTLIRRDWDGGKLMVYRMAHLAALEREAAVLLDTDVVVQRPLDAVFAQPFDVALTVRSHSIRQEDGTDITAEMPYNTGVMFSRRTGFWARALELLRDMPGKSHDWWGDQLSVKQAADTGEFKVLELPCDLYNYTPNDENEPVGERYVIHYKGRRKEWMSRRFAPVPTGPAAGSGGILVSLLKGIFGRR